MANDRILHSDVHKCDPIFTEGCSYCFAAGACICSLHVVR